MNFTAGRAACRFRCLKRDFPPEHQEKSRLGFYDHHENSIEINSSFYKLPQIKTIERWATDVPADFRFTFKLWKAITHEKNLPFNAGDVSNFMQAISGAGEKKGCLLVQFPPILQVSAKSQLHELFQLLENYDCPVAVKFRHPSWYKQSVFKLLNTYQAAMVIQDMPKSATPLELTPDNLVYLRFHGPSGNYKSSYSDGFLYEYALYIREWQEEGKTVYCYFNNTAGEALNNLELLKRCLD